MGNTPKKSVMRTTHQVGLLKMECPKAFRSMIMPMVNAIKIVSRRYNIMLNCFCRFTSPAATIMPFLEDGKRLHSVLQKLRVKSKRIVKISRRPTSISNDRSHLAPLDMASKLPLGPVMPEPGP